MAREGRSRNVVSRVLDWLRAGYPDGVPQQDYVALLGILRRHLTDEEIVEIASSLTGGAYEDREDRIRHAIQQRTLQQATDEEVSRVFARLATAGWPLAKVDDGENPAEADGGSRAAPEATQAILPPPPSQCEPASGGSASGLTPRHVETSWCDWSPGCDRLSHRCARGDYVPLVALSRRLTKDRSSTRPRASQLRRAAQREGIGAAIMGTNEVPSIEIERGGTMPGHRHRLQPGLSPAPTGRCA